MEYIIYYFDIIKTIILRPYFKLRMFIRCKIRGVNIKEGSQFFGMTVFRKKLKSQINIGKFCRFRSSPYSNLIGINRPCIISTHLEGAKLNIGNNCGFSGTVIGCFKEISIGKNVMCGANTLITDSDWHLDDKRTGEPKPIVINDNVWLGVNSVVLKGVTIGENSVIGANSLVVNDIPANVIAGGNPCKILKKLS
jgi:acetyltransferase-like isoleucine patch superfamily enzyme